MSTMAETMSADAAAAHDHASATAAKPPTLLNAPIALSPSRLSHSRVIFRRAPFNRSLASGQVMTDNTGMVLSRSFLSVILGAAAIMLATPSSSAEEGRALLSQQAAETYIAR